MLKISLLVSDSFFGKSSIYEEECKLSHLASSLSTIAETKISLSRTSFFCIFCCFSFPLIIFSVLNKFFINRNINNIFFFCLTIFFRRFFSRKVTTRNFSTVSGLLKFLLFRFCYEFLIAYIKNINCLTLTSFSSTFKTSWGNNFRIGLPHGFRFRFVLFFHKDIFLFKIMFLC